MTSNDSSNRLQQDYSVPVEMMSQHPTIHGLPVNLEILMIVHKHALGQNIFLSHMSLQASTFIYRSARHDPGNYSAVQACRYHSMQVHWQPIVQ